ncbi:MAG TPA: S41 family peptidase [Kofleriaceae bacterium]|nr:S41 family peptidase [Kofleriaceae bacterium]
MKAMCVVVVVLMSCGGGKKEMPPPAGPEAVVEQVDAAPEPVAEPSAEEVGAAWGERVERAFVAITTNSYVVSAARPTAAAAWAALDGVAADLPADDAALAGALRQRAAVGVGSKQLPPERVWAAIEAMTAVADNAHVMLVDGPRMTQLGGSIEGAPFVTPGAMVHWTADAELVVAEVLSGSPAASAGLVVGDVIVSVDGRAPRRVAPLFDAMFLPAGTKKALQIRRAGTDSTVTVTLEPFLHPVEAHRLLKGGVGLIRLYFCAKGEAPERNHIALTRAALAELDAKKATRVVIDLRGNMGGAGVAEWASIFTSADPILLARWAGEPADEPWARKGDVWPKARPIAVLVDEQTVSCGEMIAYALAEHGVARLFGQPTGGAFHVPDGVDLGEGHILMVPVGEVLGPKTQKVPDGHKVWPQVEVPNRTVGELITGKDPQLDAALAWLAKQKAPKR